MCNELLHIVPLIGLFKKIAKYSKFDCICNLKRLLRFIALRISYKKRLRTIRSIKKFLNFNKLSYTLNNRAH